MPRALHACTIVMDPGSHKSVYTPDIFRSRATASRLLSRKELDLRRRKAADELLVSKRMPKSCQESSYSLAGCIKV